MSTKVEPGTDAEASILNNRQHLQAGYTQAPSQHPVSNGLAREGGPASPVLPAHANLPHGYGLAATSQNEAHIDPELRSSNELSTSSAYPPPPPPAPTMMAAAVPPPPAQQLPGPPTAPPVAYTDGSDPSDGRKAKRELSQSKRAAQNRAAQRAFRQRKEGYIKKLEQQVRDYETMENTFKSLQSENYALREYVIHLQSRLLDAQGEYPQPPPNINLAHPRAVPPTGGADSAPAAPAAGPGASLEVVAQAVAGLARADRDAYSAKPRAEEDTRDAEEITRQLQADSTADGLPAAPM